jgi:phage shock protein B
MPIVPWFLILIIPLLVIGILILLFVLFLKLLFRIVGGGNGGSGELRMDEARTIQELHAYLEKMEKRVESLETILLEKVKPHEGA